MLTKTDLNSKTLTLNNQNLTQINPKTKMLTLKTPNFDKN